MASETATATLREEHGLILHVTDALEHSLDTLDDGHAPDMDLIRDCVEFFRLFADACHHGKEEALLFVELEQSGMRSDQGPVAVMLDEHRRGRALVRQMADALADAPSNPTAMHTLRTAAWAWIDLIRSHIGKEDAILFEIADGMIRGPRCRQLCDAYRDADTCTFESKSKTDLEVLATRITDRMKES